MKILLNGRIYTLNKGVTIAEFLRQVSPAGKSAVEVNGEIIPRSRYNDFDLREGDRIEVVHAVGGG